MTGKHETCTKSLCLHRRDFLLGTGAVATTFLLRVPGATGLVEAPGVQYPRKKIARVSQLQNDAPLGFAYPFDDFYSQNLLVKLGVPAGGDNPACADYGTGTLADDVVEFVADMLGA